MLHLIYMYFFGAKFIARIKKNHWLTFIFYRLTHTYRKIKSNSYYCSRNYSFSCPKSTILDKPIDCWLWNRKNEVANWDIVAEISESTLETSKCYRWSFIETYISKSIFKPCSCCYQQHKFLNQFFQTGQLLLPTLRNNINFWIKFQTGQLLLSVA